MALPERTLFEVREGDVVTLRSGGPRMTVQKVTDSTLHGDSKNVHCVWFDEKHELRKEWFIGIALKVMT